MRISLEVSGSDLTQEQMNTALGRAADRYHEAGQPIPGSSLRYPENEWILETEPVSPDDGEDRLASFLNDIASLADRLQALEDVDLSLSVVVKSEEPLELCLESTTITALANLGASLDLTVNKP